MAEEDSQVTSAQPCQACRGVVRHQQAKVTEETFLPCHLKIDTSQVFCLEKLKTARLTVFVSVSPATLQSEKQIGVFSSLDFSTCLAHGTYMQLDFSSNCMIY